MFVKSLSNREKIIMSKKITSKTCQDFEYSSNEAFYRANYAQRLFGLRNQFPEAGMYLMELCKKAVDEDTDVKIERAELQQRIASIGIIDVATQVIDPIIAKIIIDASEIPEDICGEIMAIHNPPQLNGEDTNVTEAVSSQTSSRYNVGFRLKG